MTRPVEVRARLVDILRRDLVGPGPQDQDLARERLSENPSRWYLTGFIAPNEDEVEADDPAMQEEDEREAEQELGSGAGGAAGDDEPSEAPVTHRRFLPSSIGLTVLVPMNVESIEARVSWGDYVTEPPLSEGALLSADNGDGASRPRVIWVRRVSGQRPEGAYLCTVGSRSARSFRPLWDPDLHGNRWEPGHPGRPRRDSETLRTHPSLSSAAPRIVLERPDLCRSRAYLDRRRPRVARRRLSGLPADRRDQLRGAQPVPRLRFARRDDDRSAERVLPPTLSSVRLTQAASPKGGRRRGWCGGRRGHRCGRKRRER